MIPRFPRFKRLELADRSEIEAATQGEPPYSDFNFVSLWCWDTEGVCELSRLDGHLVIKFKSYGSDESFLSFCGTGSGTGNVARTAATLIAYSARHGMEPRLRLVPESVAVAGGLSDVATVAEDPANFDYVLSVEDWAELRGGKFRNKRNQIHGLLRRHDATFRPLDLACRQVQKEMMQLFLRWTAQRGRGGQEDAQNELLALRRVFAVAPGSNIVAFGVYDRDVLLGFSVNETLPDGYALGHFWKADHAVPGVYPYLLHQTCRYLANLGCRSFNIEQDLGKSGLTYAKQLYRPSHFLKKYVVSGATVAGRVDTASVAVAARWQPAPHVAAAD